MRLKISVWFAAVFIVLMLPGKGAAQPSANTKESCPPSPVIKSLTIEPGRQCIGDGDNWPITWADDGDLYTVYCDGRGFGGGSGQGSMSLAKIVGTPPNHTGENIASATAHKLGGGHEGRKASGLVMVDGVLHMWVRNLEKNGTGSSLAWSSDHAKTWTWADWNFPEIGYPVWLNAGRNYEAAQDDYAYMYSPETPSAYRTSDHMLLARVPRSRISQRENYQFFAGLDEGGKPRWSSRFEDRKPVFSSPWSIHASPTVPTNSMSRSAVWRHNHEADSDEDQSKTVPGPYHRRLRRCAGISSKPAPSGRRSYHRGGFPQPVHDSRVRRRRGAPVRLSSPRVVLV